MSLSAEIERLQKLRDSGALTDEEFAQAKAALLSDPPSPSFSSAGIDPTTLKWWAVGLHLSQFAGYVVPLAGFVVPIVIWQVMKERYPEIDEHGRMVANWILSHLLYVVCSVLLAFVGVGIPLLFLLAILGIAFPIIGSIRAAEGRCWKYPLTIAFLTPRD
ncbi:MAG: hypothetical protein FD138_433 [Planctomycetota bacterium]|nr:MAG: hypothetical protein FD138_433 [Planctomycetota bacterium]